MHVTEMERAREKVQGYLDKCSKKNLFTWWRQYWFVLDGKMLLYFKSKENYEQLGTCKGSINMSMAQSVRPSTKSRHSYPLEIITRTKTVLLSACNEEQRTSWLSELQKAIRLPEISSPMRERLSSRLSANLSLKRPFSKIEEEKSADQTNGLSDQVLAIGIDGGEKDVSVLCQNGNIPAQSNHSQDEPDMPSKNRNVDESSQASTLTLKGEEDEVVMQKAQSSPQLTRRRKPSLYEEIVEEVLEIAGKRLSSQKSSDGQDDEYLIDLSSVLQHSADVAKEKLRAKTSAPSKPPRLSSIKNRVTLTAEVNQTLAKHPDGQDKESKELESESEKYESANESCYVTAESSEYEGDTSSFSSSICGVDQSLLHVEDSELHASAGSEASMESLQPQTGSMCNMLDVAGCDDRSQREIKIDYTKEIATAKDEKRAQRHSSFKLPNVINSLAFKFRTYSQ